MGVLDAGGYRRREGAVLADCFAVASFSILVAVTMVARSVVFPPSWSDVKPYY